jgi:hypothetical protein
MEYILTNFILYVRRNFKNVTIELAIHSHSAPIYMCEYSDAIKLPKCYPSPMVGGGYRISNFLMAKEINKEVKKKLQHQCLTIKYYAFLIFN